jgi:hypothetical protein
LPPAPGRDVIGGEGGEIARRAAGRSTVQERPDSSSAFAASMCGEEGSPSTPIADSLTKRSTPADFAAAISSCSAFGSSL